TPPLTTFLQVAIFCRDIPLCEIIAGQHKRARQWRTAVWQIRTAPADNNSSRRPLLSSAERAQLG
ncbi:MAG: hypothetical protein KDB23_05150, partial [Planctomycetales bacterium]|nr:hypothetical protein [Planctomycetales bacterium]